MHGHRDPITEPEIPYRDGIAQCNTGAGNELWSFGESTFAILSRYATLRERLRPYLRKLMQQAHETGEPLMRPLFYHYPEDEQAWQITDQYLFGEDVLVAPVVNAGERQRRVWLPGNTVWVDVVSGDRHEGGRFISVAAPLETLPLLVRDGAEVLRLIRPF